MNIQQSSCKLSFAGCDIFVMSSISVIKLIEQLCFPYSFSLVLLIFLWSNKSIKFVYVHRMEYQLVSRENLLLTQCYIIYVAVILLKSDNFLCQITYSTFFAISHERRYKPSHILLSQKNIKQTGKRRYLGHFCIPMWPKFRPLGNSGLAVISDRIISQLDEA